MQNIDALFDCAPELASAKDGGTEVIERILGIQGIGVSNRTSFFKPESPSPSKW